MSDTYTYKEFTKDFIVGNVALKIADIVGSEEVFADVKAKLAEMPKNELIEHFANTHESSWDKNKYSFRDREIYQYAINENFITPHDLAVSENPKIKIQCVELGYEHELLATDEDPLVRSRVLYHNVLDPNILNILWEHANNLEYRDFVHNCYGSRDEITLASFYGLDEALKNGNINLIRDISEKLSPKYEEWNQKYKTFQDYFEEHPEMCVLPETRKAKKVAEAVAPNRDIMKNAQVADKVTGQNINKKK